MITDVQTLVRRVESIKRDFHVGGLGVGPASKAYPMHSKQSNGIVNAGSRNLRVLEI